MKVIFANSDIELFASADGKDRPDIKPGDVFSLSVVVVDVSYIEVGDGSFWAIELGVVGEAGPEAGTVVVDLGVKSGE